jgi:hypothetical protein
MVQGQHRTPGIQAEASGNEPKDHVLSCFSSICHLQIIPPLKYAFDTTEKWLYLANNSKQFVELV